MKEQTPLQIIVDELMTGDLNKKLSNYNRMLLLGFIDKNNLLEKEKQMVVDAWLNGYNTGCGVPKDPETYFNNKYNTNGN